MRDADDNSFDEQIDRAFADYIQQCDSGQHPDREAFLARHPEVRGRLKELLLAADWIEDLAGPTLSDMALSGSEGQDHAHADYDPAAVSNKAGQKVQSDTTSQEQPGSSEPIGRQQDGCEDTLSLHGFASGPGNNTLPPSMSITRKLDQHATSATQLSSQPSLPCRFGEYVLERVLGRGGMGVVYLGRQLHLERPVAIKMIRSGALASDEEVCRFYAEARSAAKLDHPNIVTVYQCGEIDGHHYFSMDYVAGKDLSRVVKERRPGPGPVDCKTAARYVRDAALAIEYAHRCGILHRDLKPANILVDDQDNVHITDFGLAKLIGHESGLTVTGAALGTPSYMAPEQAAGRADEHSPATDVYALGAILFTLLSGKPPFSAKSSLQTIMQVIHRPAPMLKSINPQIDEDIETIVNKCLQKSPEHRYASAQALADDLDRYLIGAPIVAKPISWARQGWYWLLGVPIFGAILDNRVIESTDAHRWFQRGLICVAALMLCAWMFLLLPASVWFKNRIPSHVRVAAGATGGGYDTIGKAICESIESNSRSRATAIETLGSNDNLDRLVQGEAHLALLQADAVGNSAVAVVAPLYYEVVHIIARKELGLANISDLQGRRIVVGSEKAGSRQVAKQLFSYAGLSLDDTKLVDMDWRDVGLPNQDVDAAIIVSPMGVPDITRTLQRGYCLMSLRDAWEFALAEPSFHPLEISAKDYPDCELPETGIAAVATIAFLATRLDSPDALIVRVLDDLFAPAMVERLGILSAERAAHWQGLAWHPAAREFFQPYRAQAFAR